jgi:hypothetical protein
MAQGRIYILIVAKFRAEDMKKAGRLEKIPVRLIGSSAMKRGNRTGNQRVAARAAGRPSTTVFSRGLIRLAAGASDARSGEP